MGKTDERQLDEFIEALTEQVAASASEIITATVRQELKTTLPKALKEGEFFRKVNQDMRKGLEDIYREIKSVKDMNGVPAAEAPRETDKLLTEAADQLDEIMRSTEEATVRIMDIVEKHQEMIQKSGELLRTFRSGGATKEAVNQLLDLQEMHESDLTEIMTTLSFQDLTGQRIKRIIEALKHIEAIVFNVYMSTGLIVKARDQQPEKNMDELEQETQERVTKLQGPQSDGASQNDVDDLLSQLGLE
jgi:chemotaxis protein CheZ